jgi:hypothetical protein
MVILPNTHFISPFEIVHSIYFSSMNRCIFTYFCAPCSAYYTRYRVLDGDMSKYTCCQGYISCLCFKPGQMGEQNCPHFCLGVESVCCLGKTFVLLRCNDDDICLFSVVLHSPQSPSPHNSRPQYVHFANGSDGPVRPSARPL